jgi:hypothetical protein
MEFEETQQLKLWWLYILLGIETIIVCSVLFFSKHKMDWEELKNVYFLPVLSIALPYLIIYIVTKNRLTLKIDQYGISYHYWPFVRKKHIAWTAVKKAYIRKYDALSEYGGWGLRTRLWFKFNDKAYIFNDKVLGLQLELDPKKVLFSTEKPDELALFLINLKRQYNITAIETDVRER